MDVVSLAQARFGIHITKKGRDEYHSLCPFCGDGTDRFIVWEEGNYWCRQCDKRGWLNENDRNWKPDPALFELTKRRIQEQRQEQIVRLETWQQHLDMKTIWAWHQQMNQNQIEYWLKAGITEENIERYILGYCPSKRIMAQERLMESPAYTIPINDPETGSMVNIQYRLVNPPTPKDKYRQEPDIPAAAFYANGTFEGDLIIVEGAKKAIVVSQLVQDRIQVIGLPGISPSEMLIQKFKDYRRKWLIPDPGVTSKQINRFREALGKIYTVALPDKIDDCIIKYGLNRTLFRLELEMARR